MSMDNIRTMTRLHALLLNKFYFELSVEQRRVLYAYVLWQDGMDIDEVMGMMRYSDQPSVSDKEVDNQLRNTFGYSDHTQIEGE